MASPAESAGSRRVLLRCLLVLGLVSIGTVTVFLIQFALGARTVEYTVIHSAATVIGAAIGTGIVFFAHRVWASNQRRDL